MFRKNMEQDCAYCARGYLMANGQYVACKKHGMTLRKTKCSAFRYDPLKRVPKPAAKPMEFTADDFSLE